MGSMPRLKIKDELHYRKGSTNESNNCKACENFKKNPYEFQLKGRPKTTESRCALIGLRPVVRCGVREDYTCDRQEMSQQWRKELDHMVSMLRKGI